MRHYLNIVKALACDKRLRLLMALSGDELCQGAFAELVGIRPATASRPLPNLLNADPGDDEKRNRRVGYHLVIAREGSMVTETLNWVRASLCGDAHIVHDGARRATLAARFPIPFQEGAATQPQGLIRRY